MTSRFQSEYSTNLSYTLNNGDKGTRTLDPLLAKQVLSQLSYAPKLRFDSYWVQISRPTAGLFRVAQRQLRFFVRII